MSQKQKGRTGYESDYDGKFRIQVIDGIDSGDCGTHPCRFQRQESGIA
ncbi:DNA binding, excisionase family domain protein [Bacteroides fragilis str. 1007-1-F |uniref:DNA binding, excisionase family domain protein n=1 Tax=Bacteroides fragilis str. 1007-1-F \|nr:DNA binding, excisionase family domain protein [Bacteroides fragilis str. 1007-1-F \